MNSQLTLEDAKQSLNAHVATKGAEIRQKYGPNIGWEQLQQILTDGDYVRYPCRIEFDAEHLQPGEFAHPAQIGENPESGFTMYVHPYFSLEPARVPYLVLYQLVMVNYGLFASSDDAEAFGAAVLGITKQEYYDIICEMADKISTRHLAGEDASASDEQAGGGCGCGGGCSCS